MLDLDENFYNLNNLKIFHKNKNNNYDNLNQINHFFYKLLLKSLDKLNLKNNSSKYY